MDLTGKALTITALLIIVSIGLACSSIMPSKNGNTAASANKAPETANSAANSGTSSSETKPADTKKAEKADFTMTSEELDKDFTHKGVTDKDLEKYSNKNIAVTGRVTMLVMEKKGTTQPWVTLAAPGLGHGVSCYFDEENVAQMTMLKEDKMVKVQGFQDDFIVPDVSPMLKHCVVLEGAE
jgi:hypothetical protein